MKPEKAMEPSGREFSRRLAPFGMAVRFESNVEKAKEWLILEKA